jgi:hypothetical protein
MIFKICSPEKVSRFQELWTVSVDNLYTNDGNGSGSDIGILLQLAQEHLPEHPADFQPKVESYKSECHNHG